MTTNITAAPAPVAEPQKLNLQQRLLEVRKAIPAITQKKHSDNVKYKFAKIFDVYELMTPACNAWGVNFDVVEEQATRHHENGDAMFFTTYQQDTYKGSRTVYVYEADITIAWINVDDPKDRIEVTLHAIGTNDAGPDKAKGAAWTYCLKYYLFEKFGIDQGDDDPDNTHYEQPQGRGAAQNKQTKQAAKPAQQRPVQQRQQQPAQQRPTQQQPTRQPEPPAPQSGAMPPEASSEQLAPSFDFVAGEDLNDLFDMAAKIGLTRERVSARACEKYGVNNIELLTYDQFDEIALSIADAVAQKDRETKQEAK